MTRHDDWGVADGWWATDGEWRGVDDETRVALHLAQGAASHVDAPSADAPPADPPMWTVRLGQAAELWSSATLELEDGTELAGQRRLPPDLPLGVHRLRPDDGGPATVVFVVPPRAPRPPRCWGWSTQLYATRSRRSWGVGDLGDLAHLARWTAAGGGTLLAHSPLGAPLPTTRQQPSPYYASTRRFWSPLHLRVDAVRGAERLGDRLATAVAAGETLNTHARIDRDRVWALKRAVLESIWEQVRDSSAVRRDLADATTDAELARFAIFCALAEHHGSGWRDWPSEHRHPDHPSVAEFAMRHVDHVRFHLWLQVEADAQLSAASVAGAGLVADLPVGFDPSGFDAWTDQDLLALGCSVGAPPDDFSPNGQNWGLPPYVPWKLRASAYGPWLDTLRRVLRHSAALRIDHVMGLFRLFWIPAGGDATSGGYVHHRGTDLLDLAVMEATRAGATLVGEDLGTVEDEVRRALAERDVFGYRIGWFADEPPTSWPATTLASLTTHDLPTVAGLWSGQDAEDRRVAGVVADPEGDRMLRDRLQRLADISDDPLTHDAGEREVSLRAHTALARSGSDIAVAALEDAVGARSRPNLPGTIDEHPNWRLPLPVPIEDLDVAGAAPLAAIMRTERPK